ncbi:phosphopantetheine-binding protein [Streptomyces sp. 8N616]|uniref:phosphopantetheine-binding protein n=1 Tax=Streptomyces sp. 8N616 TaxID=3457414 RepID=UPI003FD4FB21
MPSKHGADVVREAIKSVRPTTDVEFDDRTGLVDGLHLDSTDLLTLLGEIEDRAGIAIEDSHELDECIFATVGTLADFVAKRLEGAPPAESASA